MALDLILGPAHAGKVAELYDRYLAELAAGRRAALVVPGAEAKAQARRDLLERAPAVVGADVLDFDELFERIFRRSGDTRRLVRGGARNVLLRRALPAAPASIGARFHRLGAALLHPEDVRAAGDDALADAYAAWWAALDGAEAVDRGRMRLEVVRMLGADVAAWPEGEVLFAQGFDDLSRAQEQALRLIAERAGAVVSLAYEPGRPPFHALAPLAGRLAEQAGADRIRELPPGAFDRHADLTALERRFGDPDPDGRAAASATGGVALAEVEGERGEAEAVLLEVAAALRAGTPAERIAVIAPRGAADRQRLVRQLRDGGIDAAGREQRLVAHTPFGRALRALLAVAWDDEPSVEDRLAWLRSPWSGAPPQPVDRLERGVRRSQEALEEGLETKWADPLRRALALPPGVRTGGSAAEEAIAGVRAMLQRAHGRKGTPADSGALVDDVAQASAVIAELERIAELAPAPDRDEVRAQIAQARYDGRPGGAGAVRVLDPRSARTVDVDVAVIVGLEEQAFGVGAAAARDPLVEAPEPADVARHLAYVAATRARRRLVLVRRVADDDGRPQAPTAIWEDLVVAAGTPPVALRRRFSDVAFDVDEAPSQRERARAIAAVAAVDPERAEALAGAAGVSGTLRRARTAWRHRPHLDDQRVLEKLRERPSFPVTALDRFGVCSSVWLVERLLDPKRIDEAVDDRLRAGNIAHAALSRVYREVPARLNVTAIGPDEADAAVAEAERIVDDAMLGQRTFVPGDRLRLDLMHWNLRRDVGRLVRRAALAGAPLVPTEFETSFGMGNSPAGRKEGVDVGVARVHGKIDRIDTDPAMTARAAVVDYKATTALSASEMERKGEIQIPIYLLALREVLGREPVAGLYVSIRRGTVAGLADRDDEDVLPPGLKAADVLEHDVFEDRLEQARTIAAERIERIRAGDIRHDPSDTHYCGSLCAYAGICRIAR